ncbi:MAG: GNAT family N-acetyltransferase [Saprospiraceae bacterium]|nr:GNAT family N-acetyltransferase [Saprospiraceae bacterium]
MFLRAYRRDDKRRLQLLYFASVHDLVTQGYAQPQLDAWAPDVPDKHTWAELDDLYCIVVEAQKIPVGFAAVTDGGLFRFFYVHPTMQGKGIGRALIKQIERFARKKSWPQLQVMASTPAQGFFEKNGFVFQEEQKLTLGGVVIPFLRMTKPLMFAVAQT